GDVELANRVQQACIKGDVALADSLLMQQQRQLSKEGALEIARLRAYILDNASGLLDYRLKLGKDEVYGLRGLGAMESNVDKMVANRLKKRGMSWTKAGAKRMCRLILLQLWGEIGGWTSHQNQTRPKPLAKAGASKVIKSGKQQGDDWLKMSLPALFGPHSSRPWVKALKTLAYGVNSL
ncbi:MAG: UPF0236 family protein, partial [Dehalococcoidales bacterium]|nr:UPF0236 family protein [Dehalococcoidales bacterium]